MKIYQIFVLAACFLMMSCQPTKNLTSHHYEITKAEVFEFDFGKVLVKDWTTKINQSENFFFETPDEGKNYAYVIKGKTRSLGFSNPKDLQFKKVGEVKVLKSSQKMAGWNHYSYNDKTEEEFYYKILE